MPAYAQLAKKTELVLYVEDELRQLSGHIKSFVKQQAYPACSISELSDITMFYRLLKPKFILTSLDSTQVSAFESMFGELTLSQSIHSIERLFSPELELELCPRIVLCIFNFVDGEQSASTQ